MSKSILIQPRPYSIVEAYNRAAAAVGATVNYRGGGHRYGVSCGYQGHWGCSYTWDGLKWIARLTSDVRAIEAADNAFERDSREGLVGSSIEVNHVESLGEEARDLLERVKSRNEWVELDRSNRGLNNPSWWTWRHELARAIGYEQDYVRTYGRRRMFALDVLKAAENEADYDGRMKAWLAEKAEYPRR